MLLAAGQRFQAQNATGSGSLALRWGGSCAETGSRCLGFGARRRGSRNLRVSSFRAGAIACLRVSGSQHLDEWDSYSKRETERLSRAWTKTQRNMERREGGGQGKLEQALPPWSKREMCIFFFSSFFSSSGFVVGRLPNQNGLGRVGPVFLDGSCGVATSSQDGDIGASGSQGSFLETWSSDMEGDMVRKKQLQLRSRRHARTRRPGQHAGKPWKLPSTSGGALHFGRRGSSCSLQQEQATSPHIYSAVCHLSVVSTS